MTHRHAICNGTLEKSTLFFEITKIDKKLSYTDRHTQNKHTVKPCSTSSACKNENITKNENNKKLKNEDIP